MDKNLNGYNNKRFKCKIWTNDDRAHVRKYEGLIYVCMYFVVYISFCSGDEE